MVDEVRLINANALHKEITSFDHSVVYKDWVQSAIASAPTISDVAPVVHARWIWSPDVTEDVDTLRCSHCKKEAPGSYTEEGDFVYHKTDFCPNCGAKMDIERE